MHKDNPVNLFFLRHGEAGQPLSVPGRDYERPLTEAGRREVKTVAESMLDLGIKPDRIVTSPLKRSHDTAVIAARVYNCPDKLEDWDELKPEGNKTQLMLRLSKLKQNSDILLVGHEPYLSLLLGDIVAGTPSSHFALKKTGLAKVRMTSFAPKASGELRWLLTPRHLKRMRKKRK